MKQVNMPEGIALRLEMLAGSPNFDVREAKTLSDAVATIMSLQEKLKEANGKIAERDAGLKVAAGEIGKLLTKLDLNKQAILHFQDVFFKGIDVYKQRLADALRACE